MAKRDISPVQPTTSTAASSNSVESPATLLENTWARFTKRVLTHSYLRKAWANLGQYLQHLKYLRERKGR